MVVAPAFTRGIAMAHAEREHVVLMEVESFLAILEMHARTPLSLYTLRDMFVRPGLYGTAPDHIQDAHEHTERLGVLLPLIIQKIEHWYTLQHVDAVNADSLFIAFIEQFGQARYQKIHIEEALAYLASPFVGALRKNDTGYYLMMPSQTVQQRLLSIRTKFFLYIKILSTFADSQPSLFTTLINKKDLRTDALYSKFKPRNSQLAP